MTGALAPPTLRASQGLWEALAPPEVLASEAALSRPSALSAALSQMLADPLWHRGLHPKLRPPVADCLIRRVEYGQPRDPSPSLRPRRPSSASQTSSAAAVAQRSASRGCSRSSSRSVVGGTEASELEEGSSSMPYPAHGGRSTDHTIGAVASVPRPGSSGGQVLIRRGSATSERGASAKPPRPGGNTSSASRPPVVPRPSRRQQSLEASCLSEDDKEPMSRQTSSNSSVEWKCGEGTAPSATPSQDRFLMPPPRSLPRSLTSGRPLSAGSRGPRFTPCSRSSSAERGAGKWPTPARARCRHPSLGRHCDEERIVPTIRAPQ